MWGKAAVRSHWLGFLCLIPFLVMLWVHEAVGLSDAVLVRPAPGKRAAMLYNFLMIGVFYAGIVAFLVHAVYVVDGGTRWLLFKIAVVVLYWGAILWFGYSHSEA